MSVHSSVLLSIRRPYAQPGPAHMFIPALLTSDRHIMWLSSCASSRILEGGGLIYWSELFDFRVHRSVLVHRLYPPVANHALVLVWGALSWLCIHTYSVCVCAHVCAWVGVCVCVHIFICRCVRVCVCVRLLWSDCGGPLRRARSPGPSLLCQSSGSDPVHCRWRPVSLRPTCCSRHS